MSKLKFLPITQCLVFLTLLGIVQIGHCIDCYDCNSDDPHCGENPDGELLILDGRVASGCPSCVKVFQALGTVWSSVTRRCGTSSETADSCSDILGNGKCVCTTTFCNHGDTIYASKTILMCIFLFIYNLL